MPLPSVVFVQFGELWNANWRMTEQMRDSLVGQCALVWREVLCFGPSKDKTDASSLCVAQLDASDMLDDYTLYLGMHIVYTLLGIAISTVQTWLYNNLATGQGESCDTCKRVQSLPAATDAAQAAVAQVAPVTQPPRAGCQFFDKLIVWLNSNLPRLCAQLSRASYQQKCVHKLTCSLRGVQGREGRGTCNAYAWAN